MKCCTVHLPLNAIKSLYFSYIHSHLIYNIAAWGNSKSINVLFLQQKRAMRIIAKKTYKAHTDPIFKINEILKIGDLYKLHLCLLAHDILHGQTPKSFMNFYQDPRDHHVNTRFQNIRNLYVGRSRTNFSQNATYKMIALTNDKKITGQLTYV